MSRESLARAVFGLEDRPALAAGAAHAVETRRGAREILRALLGPGPGSPRIALITGPSGGGKSTLLRAIASAARARPLAASVIQPPAMASLLRIRRPLIDLFRADLPATLALLSRAGLADATLLSLPPRHLSEGQRHRLATALAMEACVPSRGNRPIRSTGVPPTPTSLLLLDEFASTLDSLTAAAFARTLRRWVRAAPVRLIAATARDEILDYLAPDLLIIQDPGQPPQVHGGSPAIGRAA
jgi:ABC-type ATPase with predicted acetyltransferase domain